MLGHKQIAQSKLTHTCTYVYSHKQTFSLSNKCHESLANYTLLNVCSKNLASFLDPELHSQVMGFSDITSARRIAKALKNKTYVGLCAETKGWVRKLDKEKEAAFP